MQPRLLFVLLSAILAVGTLGSTTNSVRAEDTCATSPGQSDPGTHWYYRVDRLSNQHCWYVKKVGTDRLSVASANANGLSAGTKLSRVHQGDASHKTASLQSPPRVDNQSKDSDSNKIRAQYKPTTTMPLDPAARDTLFRQFLEWRQQQLVEQLFGP
jgi:hypothetical protein